MQLKTSPLAPDRQPDMPDIPGVRLGALEAGIKYSNRKDLAVMLFEGGATVAGVFTRSKCASAPVDWCRQHLEKGTARVLVVNSGNANAFTGRRGEEATHLTAEAAATVFDCAPEEVFLASTGVIGEPLDASGFLEKLDEADSAAKEDGWPAVARAIMTTDTFAKMACRSFSVAGKTYRLNGIAKGSGMIEPHLATMLSFLVTDYPVTADLLQKLLETAVEPSFNSITVDSDMSTSDTILLFSANGAKPVNDPADPGVKSLKKALKAVLHELAMLVVRDGEGASKHVEIAVSGARSPKAAKKIAYAIANSPLVKTAIAGEDANWGRVVMAVGKAGEEAERDRLAIWFGPIRVAHQGERDPAYDESAVSEVMRHDYIRLAVDVGVGRGKATVWTCDLTAGYVAINADYRS